MGSPRVSSEQTVQKGFGGGHNRDQHFPREVLDPDEVARLMAAMGGGARGDRNRALVAVLFRAFGVGSVPSTRCRAALRSDQRHNLDQNPTRARILPLAWFSTRWTTRPRLTARASALMRAAR